MPSKQSGYDHEQHICRERVQASATCLLTSYYIWELALGKIWYKPYVM